MACPFCTMPGGKHDDECPYDPTFFLCRHLTAEEQQAMHRALRDSVKVVATGKRK